MKLEIYRRADGLFAWRLKARNGRIVATDGGQGYVRKIDARRMALDIIDPWRGTEAARADLVVVEIPKESNR